MPHTTVPAIDILADNLCHLVRIPSVSGDGATNRAVLEWVESSLSDVPLNFRRFERGGVPGLLATSPAVADRKKPKLWLAAHTDVVPANPDMFEPKLKDGKLYGRGVFDMKYAIAVFVTLLKELGPAVADLDVGLMLTGDEEVGGANGAEFLANTGHTSRAMLLPECGIPWNLEAGAKTLTWWHLTSRGKDSHGGYPWLGSNPFPPLIEYLNLIQSHVQAEPCGDPDHAHSNMALGQISGGSVYNRVPEIAEAKIDLRTMPDISIEEIRSWFEDATAKIPSVTFRRAEYAAGFRNPSDDATKLFHDLTQEITGHGLSNKIAHASSDARFFASKGIQVICVPPLGGDQHSTEEWIDLEDLGRYYQIVKRFVTEWTK